MPLLHTTDNENVRNILIKLLGLETLPPSVGEKTGYILKHNQFITA